MADITDMARQWEVLELAAAWANRCFHRPGPGAPIVDGVAVCRHCQEEAVQS